MPAPRQLASVRPEMLPAKKGIQIKESKCKLLETYPRPPRAPPGPPSALVQTGTTGAAPEQRG